MHWLNTVGSVIDPIGLVPRKVPVKHERGKITSGGAWVTAIFGIQGKLWLELKRGGPIIANWNCNRSKTIRKSFGLQIELFLHVNGVP